MKKYIASIAVCVAFGLNAQASVILRTGVDAGQAVLSDGALDSFWQISTDGGGTYNAAKVLFPPQICCGMESVASTAKWISDPSITDSSSSTGWGIGNTVRVQRTFDLSGYDLSTVSLAGFWRVADFRQGVYLNGNLIDPSTADGGSAWGGDQAISVALGSGFFVSGVNTLELRGSSGNSQWDGFWLDATVSGRQGAVGEVPEPGTFVLMGAGVALLALQRRLRR